MPIRVNPIPRQVMPRFHESSPLRVARDSDDTSRAWIKVGQLEQQVAWLTESVKRLQDEINRLRLRRGADDAGTVSPCPYA